MKILLVVFIAILCTVCSANQNDIVFFETNIRPVLSQQCYSCHSSKISDTKGGLALDNKDVLLKGGDSGPVIIAGDPDNSLLIKALQHSDLEMPPDKKLPDDVINNFKLWIKNGAIDPRTNTENELAAAKDFWSFKPLDSNTSNQNIDSIIVSKLQEQGLNANPQADEYTLLRRVYFDLIGLPPTPEEINNYINDKSVDKYSKLLDKLLADKKFGEKWARHWLDIARYADSTGKDQNIVYPYAWRYKDYVINSINNDKPYGDFIVEQIAGDLLPHKDHNEYNNHLIATGFLAIGTKNLTENPKQYKADLIDEQIDAVTRGFLGLTLSCARCHDHKFDPFSQKDYYALYGIFQNILTLDGVDRGNNNIGYDGNLGYLIDSLSRNLYDQKQNDLLNAICDVRNIHRRIGTIRSYNPNLNENDKKQVVSELEKLDKELDSKSSLITDAKASELMTRLVLHSDPVMCIKDTGPCTNAKIMIRGDVNKLGEEVPRSLPEVFKGNNSFDPNKADTSGRLELANWIADKNNPLTYRVHVNRVWKTLFDKGVVDSFDNFGNLGGEPKNSLLLDYLTKQFIAYNGSNKKLIKEIMLTDSYRRSSEFNQGNYDKDPDNVFCWRMNEKRLQAENIRDTLLYLINELQNNNKPHSWTFNNDKRRLDGKINNELNVSKYRSIYLPTPRDFDIESLDIFDRPDNNLLSAERSTTTVPTQALYLMNNNQILSHCDNAAKQLSVSHKDKNDDEKIVYLYLKYLGRNPQQKEIDSIKKYIESSDKNTVYSQIIHILILTGEFRELK